MLVELNRNLNESETGMEDIKFSPAELAETVKMASDGVISKNAAREIVAIMFAEGGTSKKIAEEHGFIMSTDTSETEAILDKVLAENADSVESYKNGNEKIFGFLMGQVIRALGNGANPKMAKELLERKLK